MTRTPEFYRAIADMTADPDEVLATHERLLGVMGHLDDWRGATLSEVPVPTHKMASLVDAYDAAVTALRELTREARTRDKRYTWEPVVTAKQEDRDGNLLSVSVDDAPSMWGLTSGLKK